MSFDPEKITFFGRTDARGQQVPFGIRAKDRQRHMYVVGKTGMGKSTMLENMAVQDIQNGEGLAFIDPHGASAEVLLDYIPEHRVNDVVYFAPFDLDNPVSFNVMEDVGVEKRHLVVSGLMSTFKKIWVDAWSARMEYILTNALLVLIEYPDTTLLSVNRIFNDKAYRLKVVDYCTDAAVKSFWVDEFANYTERFAAEALPAIQNKIGQFTGNPLIRNIIGQPHSSFDFREMMDQKKIVIMNLSKGLIGETNANLLGSMLTTRIYLAAMSRADLSVAEMKKMPNFYFYVDEFQSFANATFANILSEARKYHLNLIIAHQYIEQMEEEVRDAVFGNVGTTIAFRVGPFDAETLETVFTPRFLAADLVNLGFAQIYLTLMIDGIGSQPFSAVTLPPIAPPSVSCKQMTIAASRKNYTKSRLIVEQIVTELHTPVKVEAKKAYPKAASKVEAPMQDIEKKTEPVTTDVTSTISHRPIPHASSHTTVSRTPALIRPSAVKELATPPVVDSVLPQKTAQVAVSEPVNVAPIIPEVKQTPDISSSSRPISPTRSVREHVPTIRSQAGSRPVVRPLPTTTTPKVRSAASVEDLRSILSRISKTTNESEKVKNDSSTKALSRNATPPNPDAVSPLSAALVALQAVDKGVTPRELPPRPISVASLPKLSQSERADLEKMAAETEAAFAALETIEPASLGETTKTPSAFTPKFSKPKPSDAHLLDPKAVAKLLRPTAIERSPFN